MKEDDQVEKRGEEVWVIASETLGIGWSFLQGVGPPKEIRLSGPSPSPTDTTVQEFFTRELEVLRTVDVWCTSCGGRCTVRFPVCDSGGTTLVPKVGEEMLGYSEEVQGWLPCKITTVMDDKWQIEWWDGSHADKIKNKTELRHFEEAGWWYRITEKTLARKCHHCQNTDGSQGQWRTQDE
jgi:hypothetical protein